jgi:hypothetical protein
MGAKGGDRREIFQVRKMGECHMVHGKVRY